MLKDAAYQEALLAKRVEFVQRLKADLANTNSVAAQTVAAYSDLVDGAARAVPMYKESLSSGQRYGVCKSSALACGTRDRHRRSCGGTSRREDRPGTPPVITRAWQRSIATCYAYVEMLRPSVSVGRPAQH